MQLQVYGPQVRQDGDFTVTVNGSGMKQGGAGFAVIDLDELGNVQLTFDTAEDIDRLITAAREAKRLLLAARAPHPFRAAEPGGYGYRCDECGVSKGHHLEPEGSATGECGAELDAGPHGPWETAHCVLRAGHDMPHDNGHGCMWRSGVAVPEGSAK